MKSTWRRFMAPLTPGSRMLLFALTIAYVVAVFGIFSHTYDLYPVLAVAGPGFWQGKIWTVVTYALLPATLVDFLFNWIMIMVLGSWLERVWSRWQLWAFCLFSALGAGVAKVVLEPTNPVLMVGTSPVVFGLLAAWGYLFAYERIMFWFLWDMTIRQ